MDSSVIDKRTSPEKSTSISPAVDVRRLAEVVGRRWVGRLAMQKFDQHMQTPAHDPGRDSLLNHMFALVYGAVAREEGFIPLHVEAKTLAQMYQDPTQIPSEVLVHAEACAVGLSQRTPEIARQILRGAPPETMGGNWKVFGGQDQADEFFAKSDLFYNLRKAEIRAHLSIAVIQAHQAGEKLRTLYDNEAIDVYRSIEGRVQARMKLPLVANPAGGQPIESLSGAILTSEAALNAPIGAAPQPKTGDLFEPAASEPDSRRTTNGK
jgi:hypothetical protein